MIVAVASLDLRTLLEFAESRAPGTLARYPEVSAAQIDQLLRACPPKVAHSVPQAAIDVLHWLGGSDDNTIAIFGAPYSTSITRMLDDLEYQVLAERFFRVAVDRSLQGMAEENIYIDLERVYAGGADAPLLIIFDEWTGEAPPDRGHTILTSAAQRIFYDFDLSQRRIFGHLGRYDEEAPELWKLYSQKLDLIIRKMGLTEAFASIPSPSWDHRKRDDLRCYSDSRIAIMFDAIGSGIDCPGRSIRIWIGADSRDDFLNYAAQIRSHMPPLPSLDEWRPPRRPGTPL